MPPSLLADETARRVTVEILRSRRKYPTTRPMVAIWRREPQELVRLLRWDNLCAAWQTGPGGLGPHKSPCGICDGCSAAKGFPTAEFRCHEVEDKDLYALVEQNLDGFTCHIEAPAAQPQRVSQPRKKVPDWEEPPPEQKRVLEWNKPQSEPKEVVLEVAPAIAYPVDDEEVVRTVGYDQGEVSTYVVTMRKNKDGSWTVDGEARINNEAAAVLHKDPVQEGIARALAQAEQATGHVGFHIPNAQLKPEPGPQERFLRPSPWLLQLAGAAMGVGSGGVGSGMSTVRRAMAQVMAQFDAELGDLSEPTDAVQLDPRFCPSQQIRRMTGTLQPETYIVDNPQHWFPDADWWPEASIVERSPSWPSDWRTRVCERALGLPRQGMEGTHIASCIFEDETGNRRSAYLLHFEGMNLYGFFAAQGIRHKSRVVSRMDSVPGLREAVNSHAWHAQYDGVFCAACHCRQGDSRSERRCPGPQDDLAEFS